MPKKSKKQYSFPILKTKEIIKCMKELQISINEIDLKSPHEEKCKLIYASILEKLMGINVLTKQIPYNKLTIFEYPSLHEASIISVRLICELIKFMQKVGVSDFSISDLISPEPSRTIRNLSAIINFARWREQKYQIYLSKKQDITELDKNLKHITSENAKLADEFVALNKQRELEKPQIDVLNQEIKQLHAEMESAHSCMQNKGEIAHGIKKEVKHLKAVDSEKKTILNKNIDEIHKLESKIVKSPKRIQKELKLLSNQIQKDKINISQKNERLNYDQNKLNHFKLLIELINKRILEMQQINVLKNQKYIKSEQEIKKLQTLKNSLEKELKSIIKQYKVMTIDLNTKKHDYSVLTQEHETRKQEIQIKNKQINDLKKQHSKSNLDKQAKMSNLDKQIVQKKESITNLLKQNKNDVNQVNIKYKQLLQSTKIYHKNMKQGMDYW